MNTQLELLPASDVVQRWQDRKARWYLDHAGLPSVRRGRYLIEEISPSVASLILGQHHYLGGDLPGKFFCQGVRDLETGAIVGTAIYGPGGAPGIRKAWFPSMFDGYRELAKGSVGVLERFCLLTAVPANAETHILKLSFKDARARGMRGVVSFSDPVARTTADGELVFPGHIGTIYKAKGMVYTGRSAADWFVKFADGTIQARRSITAWKNREASHEYVYQQLRQRGAGMIHPGEERVAYLERVMPAISEPFRHGGMHRYVARLDEAIDFSPRVTVQPYPAKAA